MKMRVYISGPITGDPDYKMKFRKAADRLSAMGFIPVDPTKGEKEGHAWTYYMKRDIRKLTKCDAIYMLHGWENSKGAQLERRVALGMDYIYMEERDVELGKI